GELRSLGLTVRSGSLGRGRRRGGAASLVRLAGPSCRECLVDFRHVLITEFLVRHDAVLPFPLRSLLAFHHWCAGVLLMNPFYQAQPSITHSLVQIVTVDLKCSRARVYTERVRLLS